MLKRFYSKRSGFTLVEIIVAFAVFSIMASMIAQILQLAISARESNNLYAKELAKQERLLTIIDKTKTEYNATDKTGEYVIDMGGSDKFTLGYQVKATNPNAENQAEGINYFISPVDYDSDGSGAGIGDGTGTGAGAGAGDGDSGSGGMSQASRMDTRITGTAGITDITVYKVVKDTFAYPDDSPFKLPEGHTRYFIEVAANAGSSMLKEDVPFAQYRMLFYSDEKDTGKSSIQYETSDGKKYTKDVYKEAKIVAVGHIDVPIETDVGAAAKGLNPSNTSSGDTWDNKNLYLVQQAGTNGVRIGTPFTSSYKEGEDGIRFEAGNFTRFYIEFEGDPNLTTASFGYNGTAKTDGSVEYKACPMYPDTFNADGTPTYDAPIGTPTHPSIYGAFINTRHYGTTTAAPEETPDADTTE